jgi:hypothetical protein
MTVVMKKPFKLSPQGRKLVTQIRKECREYGVRIFIAKREYVLSDGDKCSGYFDSDGLAIAVGTFKDETTFLAVLCHEYGHFCQWRDVQLGRKNKAAQAWRAYQACPYMWGGSLSKPERWKVYKSLLTIETDAERVAHKMLKAHNIGTAVERLRSIKSGALYLYCHRLMHDEQRWFKGTNTSPLSSWLTTNPTLWGNLPDKINGVNFTKLSRKLRFILKPLF